MKTTDHFLTLEGRKPIKVHICDMDTALLFGIILQEKANEVQTAWLNDLAARLVKPHHNRVDFISSSPE